MANKKPANTPKLVLDNPEHVFDLSPGVYAFATTYPAVFYVGGHAFSDTPLRRCTVALPEGGTVTIATMIGDVPRLRKVTVSDPVDPVPHEALLTEPRPLTLQEQIARFLGDWERRQKGDGVESFDEADDLDIDDDENLPLSKYELPVADDDMAPPPKSPVSHPEKVTPEPEQVASPPSEQSSEGDS